MITVQELLRSLHLNSSELAALFGVESSSFRSRPRNKCKQPHRSAQRLWLLYTNPEQNIPLLLQYWLKVEPENLFQVRRLERIAKRFLDEKQYAAWRGAMEEEHPKFYSHPALMGGE